jgi:hypothetical protein
MRVSKSMMAAFGLMLVAATLYRVIPGRPYGFAPQWAIAIFSGTLLVNRKGLAFLFPLLSMLISDCIYELLYRQGYIEIKGFYSGQWINYLLFCSVTIVGFFVRSDKPYSILGAAVAGPTLYFLSSNTSVWVGGGGYNHARNFMGWLQTMVDGIPFYQNSLLSTAVFTSILFGAFFLMVTPEKIKERLSN